MCSFLISLVEAVRGTITRPKSAHSKNFQTELCRSSTSKAVERNKFANDGGEEAMQPDACLTKWKEPKDFRNSIKLHNLTSSETASTHVVWDEYRCMLLQTLSVIRAIRWAISFLLVIDSVSALRLTNMSVPVVADTRHDLHMDCHFDMGAELLYAVKWYKDDQEFFRFMPHQRPNKINFPVPGVHMKANWTSCDETRCKLRLTNLTREHSGGAYRCEVSSEAPAFRLASETHNVTVATIPKDTPYITGLSDTYVMDDMLILECVSGAGDPTPDLTWYINHVPVATEYIGESFTTQVNEETSDGREDAAGANSITLERRIQPLRMRIDRRHLQGDGVLVVSCVSTMPAMPMVQPQRVAHTIIIRSRSLQVNNEKLHWPDYVSSLASPARHGRSRTSTYLTTYLSWRNFQILAINLVLIMY